MKPKQKWWTVKKQDIGREVGNPDWVDWATAEMMVMESQLAQREWISTLDGECPPANEPILIACSRSGEVAQGYSYKGIYRYEDGVEFTLATHWQPLPEPPKEADND